MAELAIQIKDRTSNGGAQRIYAAMLGEHGRPTEERSDSLRFLGLCLRSVDPSPTRVRELTRRLFEQTCQADGLSYAGDTLTGLRRDDQSGNVPTWRPAWSALLVNSGRYRDTVAGEIDTAVDQAVTSGHRDLVVSGARLALSLPDALRDRGNKEREFWRSYAQRFLSEHRAARMAAETDAYVRAIAVEKGLLTLGRALRMAEGPRVVFGASEGCFDVVEPCLQHTFDTLEHGWPRFGDPGVVASLEAFGHFLLEHHEPPWLRGRLGYWEWTEVLVTDPDAAAPAPLSQAAYLGAAAILAVMLDAGLMMADTALNLGPLSDLAPYLARRRSESAELPELAVPEEFRQTFRDWAEGLVDVVSPD